MSSKKKKSNFPWWSCDNCNIIITERDVEKHKGDCPNTSGNYPFISNQEAYVSLETFNANDPALKYVSLPERNNIIILSQTCLQLCKISIGDPVVVDIENRKLVLTAWKSTEEKPLLSAFVSEGKVTGFAMVTGLNSTDTQSADEIIVKCSKPIENSVIMTLLQHESIDKYITKDSRIILRHYGRQYNFDIVDVKPEGKTFFITTAQTVWKSHDVKEPRTCLLKKIGGLNSQIKEILNTLKLTFDTSYKIPYKSKGIIVHGPSGVGKSLLSEAVANEYDVQVFKCDNSQAKDASYLTELFKKAENHSPSIILIDDLEDICGVKDKKHLNILSSLIEKIDLISKPVAILATTLNINNIGKFLRRPGIFDKEVEIWVPNPQQRFDILKILLNPLATENITENEIKSVTDSAHGFVGSDLVMLVSESVLNAYTNQRPLSLIDFEVCRRLVKPSAIREVLVEVPNVKWDDIGGRQELKLKLKQAVEWPLKHPEAFKRLGITPLKGLLMFGPPGCSKTMIAKALATESRVNFISVKGPELFSKWVGESEKAVREVFRRAREASPSIVFFDELDALGGERSGPGVSSGSNVQDRVLAQLLTELDGVESLENVIVVGATNRPDRIDGALLRPGRLDRILHVPLPDSLTRREIFLIEFRRIPISSNVDPDRLVLLSKGYSCAQIVAVCREAALHALECDFTTRTVGMDDFIKAFRAMDNNKHATHATEWIKNVTEL